MNNSTEKRLQDEARFQDSRVRSTVPERRNCFQYLIQEAYDDFGAAVNLLHNKRILVAGCAEGSVTALARRGNEAIGVDISSAAIERLNAKIERDGLAGRAQGFVMNAEKMAFPDNSFDGIVCKGVLHHLDISIALREWSRVLRPDGALYMVEPLAYHPAVSLYRRLTPKERTVDEHPLIYSDFQLLSHHFEHVESKFYAFATVASVPFALLPRPLSLLGGFFDSVLRPVDRLLFRAIPATRYLAWASYIKCTHPKTATVPICECNDVRSK